MGSETGQDNERPVHRVWVDGFCLASCQVTNSEYLRFLDATGGNPPPFWWDSNRSEEHTSELQSRENLVCRLLLEKKKTPAISVKVKASLALRYSISIVSVSE